MTAQLYCGLHVLADDDPRWSRDPVEQTRAALAGGARVIQLRAKHAGDREVLEWAEAIRRLTRECDARFVVNDRFDLAVASDADAVHLGQDDLHPNDIPEVLRKRLAVGRSTHNLDQARRVCGEGVDYLAFGPVFGTQSKDSPYSARGLEALKEIVEIAGDLPVVAIGGINFDNLDVLLETGARGAAIIGAVAAADEPAAATRQLVEHPGWSNGGKYNE